MSGGCEVSEGTNQVPCSSVPLWPPSRALVLWAGGDTGLSCPFRVGVCSTTFLVPNSQGGGQSEPSLHHSLHS